MLHKEEPRCALDVSEGFRPGVFVSVEYLARAERPLKLTDKFLKVVLNNEVQIHELTVDVVENLDGCRLGAQEEERGAAGEAFDVALDQMKKRDGAMSETTFAAHPGMMGE
jgi:hypothetical protein